MWIQSPSSTRGQNKVNLQKWMCVCAQSLQLCRTLCDPMGFNLPGSSVHGILQARILEWVCHSLLQGTFPTQRSNSSLLHFLHCRWILYPPIHLGSPQRWISSLQFSCSVFVRLFVIPWIAARQAFLSITNSRSSLKLTSIESVMPSSHLILCCPLFLLPPILPSIRVFSNESTLRMRWPKYWSFSFSIIPSIEYPGLISFRMDWWIKSHKSKSLGKGKLEI